MKSSRVYEGEKESGFLLGFQGATIVLHIEMNEPYAILQWLLRESSA